LALRNIKSGRPGAQDRLTILAGLFGRGEAALAEGALENRDFVCGKGHYGSGIVEVGQALAEKLGGAAGAGAANGESVSRSGKAVADLRRVYAIARVGESREARADGDEEMETKRKGKKQEYQKPRQTPEATLYTGPTAHHALPALLPFLRATS
jgi:hypothetical protein